MTSIGVGESIVLKRMYQELAPHRRPWMGVARELADRVRNATVAQGIPADGTCLVFIGRGGLLLLPAFAEAFGESAWTVVTCDRVRGLIDAMPLPDVELELVVIIDAVVATGASMQLARQHVLSRSRPSRLWAASLSCTEEAVGRLATNFDQLIPLRRDHLVAGVPNGDLDGMDAGDLFQGFGTPAMANTGRTFTALVHTSERDRANRSGIHSAVLAVTQSIGPQSVLDVGCGDGDLTMMLVEPGREVVGLDPDEASVQHAAAHHARLGLSFVSSWSHLLQESLFDAIVCTMVLNAVPDPRTLIQQALRHCAPGGSQIWTILHPAFSFDESMNTARAAVEDGAERVDISIGIGYLSEHVYFKHRGQATIEQHHRPISWYVDLFVECGLMITRIVEPQPLRDGRRMLPRACIFVTKRQSSRLP